VDKMTGGFIKTKCQDCGNEQVLFSKATTVVRCSVCGATIATPKGGKAELKGKVVEVL